MKHPFKQTAAIALSALTIMSATSVYCVSAETAETVHVIVKNERFAAADGAPWTGTLLDVQAVLQADDSVESVVERVIQNNGYEFTVSTYGYISSVNQLAEYACSGSGGWMATLNDWFTADATTAYTVANGGLQSGDEIVLQYSCSWGADIGSLYGNFDTSLQAFTVDGGSLAQPFVPSKTNYILQIPADRTAVTVVPEAFNKNYQVKTYLNDYLPAEAPLSYKKPVIVSDGDTLYIGVGNPAWPSMNSWGGTADETVYTLHVSSHPYGDINGDGTASIEDATLLQRYLAEFITLDDAQLAIADIDGDGDITIKDVTALQRFMAELV